MSGINSSTDLCEVVMMSDSSDALSGDSDNDDWSDESDVEKNSARVINERADYLNLYLSENEDTDADDVEIIPIHNKKSKICNFNWKKGERIKPIIHNFDAASAGCLDENLKNSPSILGCFEAFFSPDFMQKVALGCNNFHKYFQEHAVLEEKSRIKKWKDTTMEEMYCFLAVTLLMPQVKKQKMNDYWSSDIFLSTPIFSQILKRDRYLLLLRMLHFSDNNNVDKKDKLFKLRIVIDHLRTAYKRAMHPFQNLSIDEIMLFKRRTSFKGFLPPTRIRTKGKVFILCDSKTGYIVDFIIHTGTNADFSTFNKSLGKFENILLTLMEPYMNKGHTLFVNHSYTSPMLFSWLHENKTNACGMVKKNCKNMPIMDEILNKGDRVCYKSSNLSVIQWMDNEETTMLSTLHSDATSGRKKTKEGVESQKPKCITDYNYNMSTIERTDLLLSSIESVRKSVKWYKKVFLHLVDMTLVNAHALYKVTSGNTNIPLRKYQLALVKELVTKYQKVKPRASTSNRCDTDNSPLRLIERHFPSMYPPKESTQKPPSRRCIVCSKQNLRKETRYTCVHCNVPLCVIPCFEIYHTIKQF